MKTVEERMKTIRLICTDVDGVLTNGGLHYGHNITHEKIFNVKDGAAIKWLQGAGIPVAFVSGLNSQATIDRARDLQVTDCMVGVNNKTKILEQLCVKYWLRQEEVAYIGDDLIDLPCLTKVGLACCPSDAVPEVKMVAHWIAPVAGGMGVMRALGEEILKKCGHWDVILSSFN